ncbi:MAG: terpene cyclase/mutase family protein [Planctomycetes bacterium]|nr:terpene cyclase/mutase family protein [Planctomycetota bacterium]
MHVRRLALCSGALWALTAALMALVLASPPGDGITRKRSAPSQKASLAETTSSSAASGLVLTDLSEWIENLDESKAPPPERVSRLTVTLGAKGGALVRGPVKDVAWRGIRYPKSRPGSGLLDSLNEIRVKVLLYGGDGKPARLAGPKTRVVLKTGDQVYPTYAEFETSLAQWPAKAPLVVDIRDGVPAKHALTVLAILCNAKRPFAIALRTFKSPRHEALEIALGEAVQGAAQEPKGSRKGQPLVGVRIRPDARCPWGAIQSVLNSTLQKGVSRVTLSGNSGEMEVDLYPLVPRLLPQDLPSVPTPVTIIVEEIIIEGPETPPGKPVEGEPVEGTGTVVDAYGVGGGAAGSFGQRFASKPLLTSSGITAESEAGVQAALGWLKRHQSPEGSWSADGSGCKTCPSTTTWGAPAGDQRYDVGVTGLAVLAYLGNGTTHRFGSHKRTVNRALRWLKKQQKPDGSIGIDPRRGESVYNHAYATQALCEAYAVSRDFTLKRYASKATEWILKAQNPGLGWKYGVRTGRNDTSVTGAMVGALLAGRIAGLSVPAKALEGANRWFERVTNLKGSTGYQTPGGGSAFLPATEGKFDPLPVPSAIAVFARLHARLATRKEVAAGSKELGGQLPTWDKRGRKINFYYWYHATNAQFQFGGEAWTAWNSALQAALIPNQEATGCAKGSWAPNGEWCLAGGRVYATVMGALCLESCYRYERAPERK